MGLHELSLMLLKIRQSAYNYVSLFVLNASFAERFLQAINGILVAVAVQRSIPFAGSLENQFFHSAEIVRAGTEKFYLFPELNNHK